MSAEAIVDQFIARVCAQDPDGAAALVTDDFLYDNGPMGKTYGPEELKAFLGVLGGTVDEVQFVVRRQVASGDVVLNERTDRFRRGDRWFELPIAGVFEVRGDKISLWRDYFDMGPVNELLASLG